MAQPVSSRGIEKRKGKYKTSLRMQFTLNGVVCKEPLNLTDSKRDLATASYMRAAILSEIRNGTFDYARYFPNSKNAGRFQSNKVDGAIGTLLEKALAQKQRNLDPSTYDEYVKSTNSYLLPRWRDTQISDLTIDDLEEWISSFSCKLKTISNFLAPLRRAVRIAIREKLIEFDPFSGIDLKELVDREQRDSDFVADPFNINEIKAILSMCKTPHERALWQIAFATGLRPSELIALEWPNVSMLVGKIYVVKKRVRGRTLPHLKTKGSKRAIDIRVAAYDAFKLLCEDPQKHDTHIFINERDGAPWKDSSELLSQFKLLCKKAGVRYRNPYQTRHTFGSTLLSCGEPQLYVAAQMGHSGLHMLNKHYARWIDQGNSPYARKELDSFFALWRPPEND